MKIHVNNETIYYNESGTGFPFVMLHGNMTSSVHLDYMHELLPKNIRLITPDMRGFGKSSYNNSFDSLYELADDIYKLILELSIDECYIGGWSTGGGVAMILAAKYPHIFKKVVLVESVGITGYPIYKKDSNFQPIKGKLIETKLELSKDPVQVLPILNAITSKDKTFLKSLWNTAIYNNGIYPSKSRYEKYLDDMLTQRNLVDIDFALLKFNIKDNKLYKNIVQSCLVIHGENDLVVNREMNATICENIENCVLVKGDWGHSPFVEKPQYICDVIYKFLLD